MVDGWQPKKNKNWLLTSEGRTVGAVTFMGDDTNGRARYRPVDGAGRTLSDVMSSPDLTAVKAIVERHAGLDYAIPDLSKVGVVSVFQVRCTGRCAQLLDDGREWRTALDALRAARNAGWLQPPDKGAPQEDKLTCCPPCRGLASGVSA